MIELNLRRTWYEISEYQRNNPNPLRIAQLINRVPPRHWTFKFAFNSAGRVIVEINCTPPISDGESLLLLDGTLEEIFLTDVIYLRQSGKYYTTNTSVLLREPPILNQLTLHDSHRSTDALLTLEGFWQSDVTPREIQDNLAVRSYFLENTWLGSPDLADSEYCTRWAIFGVEELIRSHSRYKNKLGDMSIFTAQSSLYSEEGNYIGHARFQTSLSLSEDGLYTMFGPLSAKLDDYLVRGREDPCWIVEIRSQILERAVLKGESTARLIGELAGSLNRALSSVTISDRFRSYMQNVQQRQKAEAANRLKQRQERVQRDNRIVFNGESLMVAPSNENEVLVLLCKLETLHALPFHEFRLWEYTARVGIDALASYQIRETDIPSQFVAVEMEYYFENFFDHDHPHNQVNLVICWDFRDDEVPEKLHRQKQWQKGLFEYRDEDSFLVLALSRISNLQLRRGEP